LYNAWEKKEVESRGLTIKMETMRQPGVPPPMIAQMYNLHVSNLSLIPAVVMIKPEVIAQEEGGVPYVKESAEYVQGWMLMLLSN